MSPDVHTWLDSLGLAAYSAAFSANKVDFAVLRDLTSDDLKEIGVTAVGDRRKLLAAIAALGTPTTEASPTVEPRPEASRRQVTVLFADLSGFTALTNSMDAEDTHAMLNRFFMAVDGAVQRFGGRIDKHIGDAVMAVFGAPVSHTNDPERALRAALEIHAAVARLDPPLAVHIGVASGQVIASSTGSDAHVEYTVTGDGVNLAARLTDMAPTGQTYLSHEVQRSVGAPFMGEPTGVQTIKGIKDPVEVWRLSGLAPEDRRRRQRFVGRTRELALFAAAFDNCGKSGSGAVHIVRGEPGIGKSHMLEEIGDLSSTYSFSVHCSTVLDFGAGEGQSPTQSLVRSLLDIRPDGDVAAHTNAVRSALTKGWTGQAEAVHLNALFDLPQDPGVAEVYAVMDNAVRVQGRLKVVRDLIAARCHAAPLLLEIEDIHWATADLLSALADIAASIRDLPCVLIMTTRIAGDPIDGNWLARTKGTPVAKRDLLPLGDDDARLLAQDYAANDPGILSTCVARAGGNPLFLEQLLRNLEAVGSDKLPGSIQGIVQARLDVLDSHWRGMIQVASVLGQRFSPDALKHLLKQEALDVSGLLDASLLREAGADLYFAHALIRDGSYETLLRSRRLELHNRAAEWFADRDLTLHARHLDLAEASDRSRAYLAAARRDIDNYQYDQALPLLERAFELDCAADVRVDLVCAKGEVLRFLGRSTEAIDAFDTALKLATDSNQLCRAHIGRAQAARQTSRYEDALESLDIAERAAEQTGADHDVALINYIRGNVYFPLGRVKDALAANERVIAFARQTNSVRLLVGALSGFGDANYMMGAMRTADNFYSQAIDLARDHHLTRDLAANLHNRGFARIFDAQIGKAAGTTALPPPPGQRTGGQAIARGRRAVTEKPRESGASSRRRTAPVRPRSRPA